MHERTDRSTASPPTWRALLLGAVLAGCAGPATAASAPAASAPAASAPAGAVAPDPSRCGATGCTLVLAIAPSVTTPIVAGPFAVTSINPGTNLELAVAADAACADVGAAWFAYSGGGVRVGYEQTLCARSSAGSVTNHGFSGHRADVSIR